jgi:copper transport protein
MAAAQQRIKVRMPIRRRPLLRLRHLRRGLMVLAGVATAVVVGAGPASAHATLESTTPSQGSEIAAAPAAVSLHFSEDVGINVRSVQVLDTNGARVDTGNPHHATGQSGTVEVGLKSGLAVGSYAVVWHVVSADSHPVGGTFTFGLGVPAGSPPAAAGGNAVVGALDLVARNVTYLGLVLMVGVAFFVIVVWPAGASRRSVLTTVRAGTIASIAAAGALLVLQGPYGSGLGLGTILDDGLLGETLSSRYGRLLVLRIVVLVLIFPGLRSSLNRGRGQSARSVVTVGALLATFSLAEHAGQGSLVAVDAPLDALHVAAATVWLGGLAAILLAILERLSRVELAALLPRWSRVAMVAVAVLVSTGVYRAWREIGSWAALLGTPYGRLVLYKIIALTVMLFAAEQGRQWVQRVSGARAARTDALGDARAEERATVGSAVRGAAYPAMVGSGGAVAGEPLPGPRPGTVRDPPLPSVAALRASVGVEAVLGVGVLTLTALLVNTVPGRQDFAPPFAKTLQGVSVDGGAISVVLDVEPTRVGPETFHLFTYTPVGAVLPFQTADATLVDKATGLGPITFTFINAAPGHGVGDRVVIPAAGQWTLTVQVHTDAATDYAATSVLTVR